MPDPTLPPTRLVVLTDGKIGDEVQCLGLAEALGLEPVRRIVPATGLFARLAPWGPVDPRLRPGRAGGPLPEPLPDLVIASGRRTVPFLRAVRRASGGRVFTAFLKDPRVGTGAADFISVCEHDRLRGENVFVTLTAPNRVSVERLAAVRRAPDPRVAALASPRVAVLVGGDSGHHRFTEADHARLVADLERLATEAGARLMITPSRRTPAPLVAALAALAARTGSFFWNGDGENPYPSLLALADAVVVTADSTNMLGEAAVSGVPVLVFRPEGGHRKVDTLIDGLEALGVAHPFAGRIVGARYESVDATPVIAAALARAYRAHRARRGLAPTALPGVPEQGDAEPGGREPGAATFGE